MALGQACQVQPRLGGVGLAAHTDGPQGGDRQSSPEALGPGRVEHLGLLPMPPTPFAVFEPTLDPGSQSIPRHIGLHAGQVGHHKPGFAVARGPTRQEGAPQLASSGCKAGNRTCPPLADAAAHLRQRAKGRRALRAILPLAIDAQEGMLSQALNRCKEPVGIQPTLGEDNDGPSGRDTRLRCAIAGGAGLQLARPVSRISCRSKTAVRRIVAAFRARRVSSRARLRARIASSSTAGHRRGEVPGAHEPGQRHSVTPVSFDPVARLFGHQRGSDHPAAGVCFGQLTIEPIPTGAGVRDKDQMFGLRLSWPHVGVDVAGGGGMLCAGGDGAPEER